MAEVRANILGDRWTIRVVSEKQMKKIRGADREAAGGLCVPVDRMIYLDKDCVDYTTVAHELFHSYAHSLHLDDTNELKISDAEEIFAAMFSARGDKMVRQAKRIVKDLIKQMSKDEE